MRLGQIIDRVVNRVGLDKGLHRAQLVPDPGFDLGRWQVRASDVQPTRRQVDLWQGKFPVGGDVDRAPGFHGFRDRLEPDPCAGIARQGNAVFAETQVFLDAGRVQRRHEPRHERHVRLMWHGRGHTSVVVARHHQHPALG